MIPTNPWPEKTGLQIIQLISIFLEKGGLVRIKYENVVYVWGEFHSYLQVYSIKSEVVIWNSWVLIRYMKKDVDFFVVYFMDV